MKTITVLLGVAAVAAVAAACGDASDEVLPDGNAVHADAHRTADGAPADATSPPADRAYVVGTDFSTSGILSRVDMDTRTVTSGVVAGVASTDPVLRYFDGKLYIVNRFGADNITIVNPVTEQLVAQISSGAGTNPQDVAVKGTKLYVAALNSGDIIILDQTNPSATPGGIDISSYDTDGVPDAHSLYLVGDLLFVSLAHLDNFVPTRLGSVLVIDTTTDTVLTQVDLSYQNPFGWFAYNSATQQLLLTTTPDFATGGCVQRIQTTAPYTADCLVQNSALGGYAARIAVADGKIWLAVNASFSPPEAWVVPLDASNNPSPGVLTPSSQVATDLAICPSGAIVITDTASGGLRVYKDGGEVTSAALDVGLPPAGNGIVCF